MNEPRMDDLIRRAMSVEAPPALSPAFESRLERRLQPRRLDRAGRLVLVAYLLASVVVSVLAMRYKAIDWPLVAAATLIPLAITIAINRRHLGLVR